MVARTGLVQNAFQLFLARLGSGLGQSYQLPVNGPLLIDTYPIQARARVFALSSAIQMVGRVLAPFFAGGDRRARRRGRGAGAWVFLVTAVAGRCPSRLRAARLHEPQPGPQRDAGRARRGARTTPGRAPDLAQRRLRAPADDPHLLLLPARHGQRSASRLFSVPLFLNLLLEDELGLDAFERGLFSSATRRDPGHLRGRDRRHEHRPPVPGAARRARSCSSARLIAGVRRVHRARPVHAERRPGRDLRRDRHRDARASFFGRSSPRLSAVIPYRLRSRGIAMVGIYIFLLRRLLRRRAHRPAQRRDRHAGPRSSLVVLPSSLIGGALIAYGARHIRGDMARAASRSSRRSSEELARAPRGDGRDAGHPGPQPRLLLRHGAGALRRRPRRAPGRDGRAPRHQRRRQVDAAAGHQRPRRAPSRGVVRFNGRTVTYADPELRVKIGIVQLMGGKAIFPSLTVAREPAHGRVPVLGRRPAARVDTVLAQFPVLAERRRRPSRRPLRRPAADARAGDDVDPRARGADHRRAVARLGPDRRPGAAVTVVERSRTRA